MLAIRQSSKKGDQAFPCLEKGKIFKITINGFNVFMTDFLSLRLNSDDGEIFMKLFSSKKMLGPTWEMNLGQTSHSKSQRANHKNNYSVR